LIQPDSWTVFRVRETEDQTSQILKDLQDPVRQPGHSVGDIEMTMGPEAAQTQDNFNEINARLDTERQYHATRTTCLGWILFSKRINCRDCDPPGTVVYKMLQPS
jgi:hypothetical protein